LDAIIMNSSRDTLQRVDAGRADEGRDRAERADRRHPHDHGEDLEDAQYRRQVLGAGEVTAQHEVDRMFAALRGTAAPGGTLPKGLGEETLDVIVAALRTAGALSAAEVAARTGISRVTARRYLEHLVEAGQVGRSARYGGPGRPEVEYQIK
jgi:response regulator of citrate/malate metabolism